MSVSVRSLGKGRRSLFFLKITIFILNSAQVYIVLIFILRKKREKMRHEKISFSVVLYVQEVVANSI